VAGINGSIGNYALSGDGKRIAFTGVLAGAPTRSYDQSDLFVVDVDPNASPRNLTIDYDYDIGPALTGDQHSPRGALPESPIWTADGSSVVVGSTEQGRTNLRRFDVATGRHGPVTDGDREIVAYTATPGASAVALIVSSQTTIGDLVLAAEPARDRLTLRPLVRPNAELFGQLAMEPAEEVWYRSFDGTRIHGWVQKPLGFDPARKHPLILQIHGGPHVAYGHAFYHEIQWMAARGYVVLYVNPRGSASYGQQFGNVIQYRYPGDDFKDLMVGVDTLVARGYVDPKRLGVTGGSGGGLLTNWTVTQTSRFAAAVSQRSVADFANFWYTADFAQFIPDWFRRAPWQDPQDYAARSPIAYVERVTTPLMLIDGNEDFRSPPGAGGELMFRALKFLKRSTVMVRFPGESHELSRSGQPRHRVERLRHIINWFDLHLNGKQVDGYSAR